MSRVGRERREWDAIGVNYRRSISAGTSSSAWLRDTLLKPAVVELLGDRSKDDVLDVGTGGGWLFDEISVGSASACDISPPEFVPAHVDFRRADVLDLPYAEGSFDAVVASVVLCYVADLSRAAAELARVTRRGGSAVIAMVHPYFYRTGVVEPDKSLRITADLSAAASFPIYIGGSVGPFTYHPHRPDLYLNAFARAGWRLTRAQDIFISAAEYDRRYAGMPGEMRRAPGVPLFSVFGFDLR